MTMSHLVQRLLLASVIAVVAACASTTQTGYLTETVVLTLATNEHGTVTDVVVQQSSGYPEMDKSAAEAAWNWHFEPAVQNGTAVPSVRQETVRFRVVGEEHYY